MYIASVPLFMLMLLMLPNGARFVCTKSLSVNTEMETRSGVLPSHTFGFFPPCLLAAMHWDGQVAQALIEEMAAGYKRGQKRMKAHVETCSLIKNFYCCSGVSTMLYPAFS